MLSGAAAGGLICRRGIVFLYVLAVVSWGAHAWMN
jgi:hypothetical protein